MKERRGRRTVGPKGRKDMKNPRTEQKKRGMNTWGLSLRGRWLLLAVGAGLTVGGSAYGAFPHTNVDLYTGWLNTGGNSGGTIPQVGVGNRPLQPRRSTQQPVP